MKLENLISTKEELERKVVKRKKYIEDLKMKKSSIEKEMDSI